MSGTEPRRDHDPAPLRSRRQVLAGATYGLGAALLFQRAPVTLGRATADPTRPGSDNAAEGAVVPDATRLAGDGQPRSICRGRAGVIVVGMDGDEPVSWTNDDRRWHEHTLAVPAPGDPDVWGVAAHGDRFLAVGSMLQQDAVDVGTDREVPGEQASVTFTKRRRRPTVWWTADRERWEGRMLDVDEAHAQLISVSCNSVRLVAVGSTLDADGVQGDGAFALISDDHGETWERGDIAAADATLAEGSFTGVTLMDGRWFATSTDIEGGAVWTSDDGRRWSIVPASAKAFRGITLQGLGVRRGRVYVAGTRLTDQTPCYFASADACRTWRPLRPGPRTLAGGDVTVNDLTVMSGDIVVVGTRDGSPIVEGGASGAAD